MSSGKRRKEYVLLELIVRLSVPSMLAQLSSIVMLYIDASMVGSLGAEASASIGLVSTTTWLFNGVCAAAATAFSVQAAHRIGADDMEGARAVLRQSFVAVPLFGLLLSGIGCSVSGSLPGWLGGNASIVPDAARYFLIYSLSLPFLQLNFLSGGMLRCSGNMRIPSMLSILMCVLDVVFNTLLIFPSRELRLGGWTVSLPGADMGVAVVVVSCLMTGYLCLRSPELALLRRPGSFRPTRRCLAEALRIGGPVGCEHIVICGAQIMSTVIVAPLGTAAIAANAFAITAESLCYMPGYGIADAATTLVGQGVGAGRQGLARKLAGMTVGIGMAVMVVTGLVMYLAAPQMIGVMTPDAEIRSLGTAILRIEAFAEPMFAASIVAYGAFVGAGDTLVPSFMNFFSMWAVRLTLAALLAPVLGLRGVWIAMCAELCFRGAIFLLRLWRGNWLRPVRSVVATNR